MEALGNFIQNMAFPTDNPYKLSGDFGNSTLEPTVAAALRILHESPAPFNTEFFSRKNVDFIQKKLISETKRYTSFDIGPQNEDELIMMMAGIYVQDSTFDGNIKAGLKKLNTLVITECLKQILSGIRSYALYVRDASLPFSGGGESAFRRPDNVSIRGSRSLPGFLPLVRE
ncbi:hypothetical protein NY2A_B849R [Paramecium bursaria Chlorella virus NY2A]|uniref:Uncharacterized protein B849R n=1 Tax=Paramecium bursaria Chlorella virus NY2A TaxID=46021 RepID=A7IY24_PBCVN|nr:hypothetical protein NY2A_B849R [Paramecium bursaria Chlorella virus NY2A]ABT15248.1 hypothetical protein NY2A_B849R [Paramecium bursaria Chlorella virus NY2A]